MLFSWKSVEKRVLLQIHSLLGPIFLQLAALLCPYLHHLLVELAQHMLPHGLLHEDTQICVGEPATPHALFFSHTAKKKKKKRNDGRDMDLPHESRKAASAQAGLEKTLLKLCRKELQSLRLKGGPASYFTAAGASPSRGRVRLQHR